MSHHKKINRNGVSEIVSYVLLIVIAVGVAALVFAFLKVYVPKFQVPECPEGISLIIQDYSCEGGKINLEIYNKGLFNISGAYIRFGGEDRKVKDQLNQDNIIFNKPLAPGDTLTTDNFPLTSRMVSQGPPYAIEIQPAILDQNSRVIPCKNFIIESQVTCS